MRLDPYRRVLRLPGVRPVLVLGLLGRVPLTAVSIVLTLHVALDRHRGYGAAGLTAGAVTAGAALGAPVAGRVVDRYGARPVVAVTLLAQGGFWTVARWLPWPALLAAAFAAGLLSLPIQMLLRQAVAALVGEADRRAAYALDSIGTELSYMVGPALAVLVSTVFSPGTAMVALGAGLVLAGVALLVQNPPVRGAAEPARGHPVPRREWLHPALLRLLLAAAGTTVILAGTDVAVVAILRRAGEISFSGAVFAAWGAGSIAGGFLYGAARRAVGPLPLVALLGALTVPVGLAGHWWTLCLAILPAGLLCAPAIAATVDAVSRLVPAGARGVAMGLHGAALTLGMATGAPLAGAVIDAGGPPGGFAVVGLAGLLTAGLAGWWGRGATRRQAAVAASRSERSRSGQVSSIGSIVD